MKRRASRRRVITLGVAAVAVLVSAKLLTLDVVLRHRPDLLALADVVEPWKSDLARGDARFAEGDLAAAVEQFRAGVDRAPDDGSRCLVRVNLALTRFQQAQVLLNAQDEAAVPLLTETAAIADERSGERCGSGDADTLAAVAEAARQALVRTELPDLPATGSSPAASPTDPGAAVPGQDDLDAVAREAQQGAAERGAQGDRERFQGDGSGASVTPW